ncbi:MAG TPA: hypothetical protein VLN73_01330 [Alphaproteobacteria bacterium]|nr:hypothetical protein [Alphaproteobacteria bacterium]
MSHEAQIIARRQAQKRATDDATRLAGQLAAKLFDGLQGDVSPSQFAKRAGLGCPSEFALKAFARGLESEIGDWSQREAARSSRVRAMRAELEDLEQRWDDGRLSTAAAQRQLRAISRRIPEVRSGKGAERQPPDPSLRRLKRLLAVAGRG